MKEMFLATDGFVHTFSHKARSRPANGVGDGAHSSQIELHAEIDPNARTKAQAPAGEAGTVL